uniref:DnaJ homolog subfamily C member 17 n=1 Tax=Bracon brevicornis TaxID=1563983 RepID=A0A6V7K5L9_9HYME
MEDLMNADLYGLFGIAQDATLKEIKTAYRKTALSCHPDKNPDNPRAAERFHELSRALEILTDASARAAYDRVLFSKAQAKLRSEKLDARRKKFKDDLEYRESQLRQSDERKTAKTDEQKLKEEIERLEKEGSKLVEEEMNFISKKIAEEFGKKSKFNDNSEETAKIKIKWNKKVDIYNYDNLYNIFNKYGDISALILSANKKGRALVEFKKKSDAEFALTIERGLMQSPLTLEKLWGDEKRPRGGAVLTATSSTANYEDQVLADMRRAEERKRIIEQMKAEDEKEENDD